jgi:hypothetical protein
MREHAHDEEVAPTTHRADVRPEVALGGSAGQMLHLQRTAGNAAVSQAIQGGGLVGPGLSIQRQEEEEETEEEPES